MRKFRGFMVVFLSVMSIAGALIVGGVFWENSAGKQREEPSRKAVASVISDDRITEVDVHGRPHVLYQLFDDASTVYVKVKPLGKAIKEEFIVNEVRDNSSGSFSHFLRFPHPEGTVVPVLDKEGAYTNKAKVNGEIREYSLGSREIPVGKNIEIHDQLGNVVVDSPLNSSRMGHASEPVVTKDDILVEVTY